MRAARTTLELTLNPNYVRSWGAWEAIRELLQNAQDAEDIGNPMQISYITNTKVPMLRIVNHDVTIDRDTLLLGTTTKADDPRQRGKFGEGFKLAWLVLTRMGYKVRCRSAEEQWIPRIEHSDQFGAEVLKVDCSPVQYRNAIQIDVIGLCEEDWKEIRGRCLFLSRVKKNNMIELGYDRILTGDKQVGMLYVKGIFVGRLPGKYYYGYDLEDVELDRDRRLADPWSLKYAVNRVLNRALAEEKVKEDDLWQLLQNDEYEEGRAVRDNCAYTSNTITQTMAKMFQDKHGKDAVPVSNTAETIEAKHYGIKAVAVSRALQSVVERETGSYETKMSERRLETKQVYSAHELNEEEENNFCWALGLANLETLGLGVTVDISVVEFYSQHTLGMWRDGRVELARRTLSNRRTLIATLVHELAHAHGRADGSVEHRDACDDLFAKIIVSLSR